MRTSLFSWLEALAMFFIACFIAGCGAGPQVRVTPDYRAEALRDSRVLLVPLAVSDDLGDERTGIVLNKGTRSLASDAACNRIAAAASDYRIVCSTRGRMADSSAISELELLFALDKPIPEALWRSLRRTTRAGHALLFRPESVSSSRSASRTLKGPGVGVFHASHLLGTSLIVSAILGASTYRVVTEHSTEVSYTVSASLVDMGTGKLLKVGVHSESASRTVQRNLGFAEAPPAAPILEEIMVDLGEEVLDD